MRPAQTLLCEIEAAAVAMGITPKTLARKAVNDGKLVSRLRNGGSVRLETAEKVRDFISSGQSSPKEAAE